MDKTTQEKYYCAGRYCEIRNTCHRHTSSVHVQNADFNDWDLAHIQDGLSKPCKYFVDRNEATGLKQN